MDPEKRLTCSELLRLPYLAGVEATIPATTLQAQVSTGTSMLDSPLLCCHCSLSFWKSQAGTSQMCSAGGFWCICRTLQCQSCM